MVPTNSYQQNLLYFNHDKTDFQKRCFYQLILEGNLTKSVDFWGLNQTWSPKRKTNGVYTKL